MLSDSLIIGLVVLLLCSAACFYMYVRIMFIEKKVTVMESILVDVRVALDSVMMEQPNQPPPLPISHTPGATLSAPAPLDPSESEVIPEENFYSSVLEQAHDAEASNDDGEMSIEKALESFDDVSGEAVFSSPSESVVQPASVSVGPNFDAMTRAELVAVAEKKGLRVKRSASRGEVLSLLRRSDPTQNEQVLAGADNVSQPVASFNGNLPMDLGSSGSDLETRI